MRGLLALSLTALMSAAGAADLTVTVTGVRSAQGDVRIALYDRAEGFRKASRARQVVSVPAAAGSVATTFTNLSNSPQVMGPPAFNDAAFDLSAKGESITIPLSY